MSFSEVVGLPWEPVPGREGIEVKSSVAFAKETDGSNMSHRPEDAEKKKKVRAVYISRADISRYNDTRMRSMCEQTEGATQETTPTSAE